MHEDLDLSQDATDESAPELVIYVREGGLPVLTYKIDITPVMEERWIYFVNAHTGIVEHRIFHIHNAVVAAQGQDLLGIERSFAAWSENSLFYAIDPRVPVNAPPFNPLIGPKPNGDTFILDARNGDGSSLSFSVSTSPRRGWDPAAVSAIYNTNVVYSYFLETFGRRSFDNNNGNLLAVTHFGRNYDNAFWNGAFMVYGDGGQNFFPLVRCLDVAAHEMTHGVIEHAAGLIYENQSGALNESFADVFAVMVDRDDWTLGENCTRGDPGFLRSLSNPGRGLRAQPAHMSEYKNLPNTKQGDHGGVHVNSGIPNRAAYLIAEGLSAEGLGASIGREQTERIYYRALTVYLQASSQFINARRALIQSAEDLYDGASSQQVRTVAAAWDAVGVTEGHVPDPGDPSPRPGEPVPGGEAMAYLSRLRSGHLGVFLQQFDSPFSGYDPELDAGPFNILSGTINPASETRPAVVTDADGTFVFYVGTDDNIYGADVALAPDSEHLQITTTGDIFSIAISPDGRYFAYTSVYADDDKVYLIDLEDEVFSQVIVPPLDYQQDSRSGANTVRYVDALTFDYTSSLILFDVLNCLSFPQDPCGTELASGYNFWTVGLYDINRDVFFYPFPNQRPSIDLAYPSFASNNDFQFAMDLLDYSAAGTVRARIVSVDLDAQSVATVADFGSRSEAIFGVPSFWGYDDYITIADPRVDPDKPIAYRVPIDAEGAGNLAAAEKLNDFAVLMPVMHRLGQRSFTGDLEPSSTLLDFGEVDLGRSVEREFTLTNTANRDLSITHVVFDGVAFSHNATNIRLPRGTRIRVSVVFSPISRGVQTGWLLFQVSNQSEVSVALTGNGRSVAPPPSPRPRDGGEETGGGCTLFPGAAFDPGLVILFGLICAYLSRDLLRRFVQILRDQMLVNNIRSGHRQK